MATARSVSVWVITSVSVRTLRYSATCGILVDPPHRRISSMSEKSIPMSSNRPSMTSLVALSRNLVFESNSSRVILYLPTFPSYLTVTLTSPALLRSFL